MSTVAATFQIGESDTAVDAAYAHERQDPDHVIFQRQVDGRWTDVTRAQVAEQSVPTVSSIAEGVQPGDRGYPVGDPLRVAHHRFPAILSTGAVTVPIHRPAPLSRSAIAS